MNGCPPGSIQQSRYVSQAPQAPGSVRPAPESVSPSVRANFFNFTSKNLAGQVVGTDVNAAFPLVRRLTGYTFPTEVGITQIAFNTTILNGAAGVAGLHIMRDQGSLISLNQSSDLYISHVTLPNSSGGSATPSNRSTNIAFGPFAAVRIPAGSGLAIYASGADDAALQMAFSASIFWIPLV